jgi:hypothetical protein
MNLDRKREIFFSVVVAALVVAGATVQAVGGDVEPGAPDRSELLFHERSQYCMPVPGGNDLSGEPFQADATAHLVGAPTGADPVTIGVDPSSEEPVEVQGNLVTVDVTDEAPVRLVGYGPIGASTHTSYRGPTEGLGAAGCSDSASSEWVFPAGSSARGFNEWIVLYNPFPDEAVVRIDLLTEDGPLAKSAISDVPVPAGKITTVRINDVLLQRKGLGVRARSIRGRVVAWKTMFAQPEGRAPGVGMTLGAPGGSTDWYFPVGGSAVGIEEHISIANPTEDEAIVTVLVITDEEAIPIASEETVPAGSVLPDINLRKVLEGRDLGGTSVWVSSLNDVEVVAEQSIFYNDETFKGFVSEIGASTTSSQWWVGPAATSATSDALLVMTTSEEEVSVDVQLFAQDGEPITSADLSGLTISAGGRLRIPLDEITGGRAAVALVTASAPVVAQRIAATSADVASVMGLPIGPDN